MKHLYLVCLAMLTAACSAQRVRCDGPLRPINTAAEAARSAPASTPAKDPLGSASNVGGNADSRAKGSTAASYTGPQAAGPNAPSRAEPRSAEPTANSNREPQP